MKTKYTWITALFVTLVSANLLFSAAPQTQFENAINNVGNKDFDNAKTALQQGLWDFDASSVVAYGQSYNLPDDYNYILFIKDSVVIQAQLLSLPQSDGVTGFQASGKATQTSLSTDNQGNLVYSFLFSGEGINAKIVLRVIAGSNTCNLGIYPQQAGNYLTFTGVLTPNH